MAASNPSRRGTIKERDLVPESAVPVNGLIGEVAIMLEYGGYRSRGHFKDA